MDNETRNFLVQIIEGFQKCMYANFRAESSHRDLQTYRELERDLEILELCGDPAPQELLRRLEELRNKSREDLNKAHEEGREADLFLRRLQMLIEGKELREIDLFFEEEEKRLAPIKREIEKSFEDLRRRRKDK